MIVITAPTGQIGHQVLDRLLDAGRPVRVIARDPSRLSARARGGAEVVQGSHRDPDMVMEAFAGADSLLWLVPPNPRAEDIEDHYLGFTRPACEALRTHGVRRVVGVTSLGRAYAGHAGLLSPAFAMDAMIESTGVSYRALAMPYFMENLLNQLEAIRSQGVFRTANSADRPLATVATRDIAAAAADLLLDGSWTGHGTVPVIGPDELSPEAMAEVLSEELGRPVRCEQMSLDAYKATMKRYGMTEAWAQGLADMAAAQNDGIYDAERNALPNPAPTGFRQWCQEVLRPAVLAG
ncbi:NmrA family transcriptional regulator [Streptomyces lucensis JCM 4490]|uniref:NmrA family transcriptional regulator n=1 Tax=Streptomyces lucensis JCM 4490 TaxID=1306176 RepID=A0A918J1J8_9ACTN|nr:NAD(P)H-binding protein [Streptomyces lucensis]GGW39849.1 NmrA family transcriptional regulator [Streptomyces lucensis JCM 4490]